MVQVIYGKKGTGKTKRILDLANEALKQQHGDIIFIDDDNRYMFDLRHEVRFINASDYQLKGAETFIGFLCGLLAGNFDISQIYIDGFLKLVQTDINSLEWFFNRLDELTAKHNNVQFIISCNGDDCDAPEYLKKYVI